MGKRGEVILKYKLVVTEQSRAGTAPHRECRQDCCSNCVRCQTDTRFVRRITS